MITRDHICRCDLPSTVGRDLELFASVESTEHLLETVIFGLRYSLLVGYLVKFLRVLSNLAI